MGKDYYGTLGVKREADENELKKGTVLAFAAADFRTVESLVLLMTSLFLAAYRKLAVKWHPVGVDVLCLSCSISHV